VQNTNYVGDGRVVGTWDLKNPQLTSKFEKKNFFLAPRKEKVIFGNIQIFTGQKRALLITT
jgi:hypothetical protein